MRCSRRGGAYSHPSALWSTFSLGSAPSGASWSAAQHHDQCTHFEKVVIEDHIDLPR